MEPNQAAEHLQTIRTLMERSAVYRRALAPIMIYCGIIGITGGVVGDWLPLHSARGFVLFWVAVAVLALVGSFILVRRQALKDSEPFWSPPTRRVTRALLPPFAIAAFISLLIIYFNADFQVGPLLVPFWCFLFGCALHSAGFSLPHGVKLFGWLFIIIGGLWCLGFIAHMNFIWLVAWPYHLMGGIFGGLHLAYGIYLYFTEKRGNES